MMLGVIQIYKDNQKEIIGWGGLSSRNPGLIILQSIY